MNNMHKFIDENNDECADLLFSDHILDEFDILVDNSNYSVYALSGGWGTGKTSFIKMWEAILKNKNKRFIYIDAFKMDYETEPFLMLLSAFKEFINSDQNSKNEILDKFKKIFTLRNITKLGFNIFIDKVGGDVLKDFINSTLDNCFDTISEEKSLYDELSFLLETIVNKSDNLPLHIIIDELDRCRPDFALETLERIKHIFHIKKVKYILVYNEEVLKSMIKTKYGIEVDTERYLHKFVQKTYVLDNTKWLETWYMQEIDNKIESYLSPDIPFFLKNRKISMLAIKEKYGLTLRDMKQLFANLKQLKYNNGNDVTLASFISLEILRFIDKKEYESIKRYFRLNIENKEVTRISSNERLNEIFNFFKPYIKNPPETPDESIYNFWKY
jgi:hypothetical protein